VIAPSPPLVALKEGRWFKLICGASYQHLPAIRSLALAYALAGADCIDIAADPSVLAAVQAALTVADRLAAQPPFSHFHSRHPYQRPWLMVSLNDGEDPHFRKAQFDPAQCPADCPRPCEAICPADAIAATGVLDSRCYGCGRCFPVCPLQIITPRAFSTPSSVVAAQLLPGVDAVEIHTQVGHRAEFERLWQSIRPHLASLKLVAISCPYGPGVVDYLWDLYRYIGPLPIPLIWQADGRPMSGDIGAGTTHATLRYGQALLALGPPGFVQLAGGTNHHTATKLQALNRDRPGHPQSIPASYPERAAPPTFGGVAYGSYARRLLAPLLSELGQGEVPAGAMVPRDRSSPFGAAKPTTIAADVPPAEQALEQVPELLYAAVCQARGLVAPLKGLEAEPLRGLGSAALACQPLVSRAPTPALSPPGSSVQGVRFE
jgi:Fe-S-cluster-containing hydrogenase component 2